MTPDAIDGVLSAGEDEAVENVVATAPHEREMIGIERHEIGGGPGGESGMLDAERVRAARQRRIEEGATGRSTSTSPSR